MLLTATSLCILPVATFNGAPVGGKPYKGAGPITQKLIDAYIAEVKCDFVQQYLDRLPN